MLQDLPATFALGMVSVAARSTGVEVNADHREGLNVFICAAAPKRSGESTALALHLASGSTSSEIDGETMRSALLIAEYFLEWALRLFQPAVPRAAVALAVQILDRAANSGDQFAQRDLQRALPRGTTAGEVADALAVLQRHLCVRPLTTTSGPAGGRPSKVWQWNPSLLERASETITLL